MLPLNILLLALPLAMAAPVPAPNAIKPIFGTWGESVTPFKAGKPGSKWNPAPAPPPQLPMQPGFYPPQQGPPAYPYAPYGYPPAPALQQLDYFPPVVVNDDPFGIEPGQGELAESVFDRGRESKQQQPQSQKQEAAEPELPGQKGQKQANESTQRSDVTRMNASNSVALFNGISVDPITGRPINPPSKPEATPVAEEEEEEGNDEENDATLVKRGAEPHLLREKLGLQFLDDPNTPDSVIREHMKSPEIGMGLAAPKGTYRKQPALGPHGQYPGYVPSRYPNVEASYNALPLPPYPLSQQPQMQVPAPVQKQQSAPVAQQKPAPSRAPAREAQVVKAPQPSKKLEEKKKPKKESTYEKPSEKAKKEKKQKQKQQKSQAAGIQSAQQQPKSQAQAKEPQPSQQPQPPKPQEKEAQPTQQGPQPTERPKPLRKPWTGNSYMVFNGIPWAVQGAVTDVALDAAELTPDQLSPSMSRKDFDNVEEDFSSLQKRDAKPWYSFLQNVIHGLSTIEEQEENIKLVEQKPEKETEAASPSLQKRGDMRNKLGLGLFEMPSVSGRRKNTPLTAVREEKEEKDYEEEDYEEDDVVAEYAKELESEVKGLAQPAATAAPAAPAAPVAAPQPATPEPTVLAPSTHYDEEYGMEIEDLPVGKSFVIYNGKAIEVNGAPVKSPKIKKPRPAFRGSREYDSYVASRIVKRDAGAEAGRKYTGLNPFIDNPISGKHKDHHTDHNACAHDNTSGQTNQERTEIKVNEQLPYTSEEEVVNIKAGQSYMLYNGKPVVMQGSVGKFFQEDRKKETELEEAGEEDEE